MKPTRRSLSQILRDTARTMMTSQVKGHRKPLGLEAFEERVVPANWNVASESDLRTAIVSSNNNTDVVNTINLLGNITLTQGNPGGLQENLSATGDLDFLRVNTSVLTKRYNVNGNGWTINQAYQAMIGCTTVSVPDRIAQVIGSDVSVYFRNVQLTGGQAVDNGTACMTFGQTDSLGGGVLNQGGAVFFTSAHVATNSASGANGATGANGVGSNSGVGNPGGNGTNGRNAAGGGLYSAGGSVSIVASTFDKNVARDQYNEDGPVRPRRVMRRFVNEALVLELRIEGRVIGTTSEHPFFVRGKGWVKASEIQPGDEVRLEAPGWKCIEEVIDTGRTERVYNVEVEDDHTYFVGNDDWGFGVWVHNAACLPIGYSPVRAAHGALLHNSTLVHKALSLLRIPGVTGVRTNQALVGLTGKTISPLRPDVQYVFGGLIHIIEVNVSRGSSYHAAREALLRSRLGSLFGSYRGI